MTIRPLESSARGLPSSSRSLGPCDGMVDGADLVRWRTSPLETAVGTPRESVNAEGRRRHGLAWRFGRVSVSTGVSGVCRRCGAAYPRGWRASVGRGLPMSVARATRPSLGHGEDDKSLRPRGRRRGPASARGDLLFEGSRGCRPENAFFHRGARSCITSSTSLELTAESFGGPDRFTRELGFQYLIDVHRHLQITDEQRERFVALYMEAARRGWGRRRTHPSERLFARTLSSERASLNKTHRRRLTQTMPSIRSEQSPYRPVAYPVVSLGWTI